MEYIIGITICAGLYLCHHIIRVYRINSVMRSADEHEEVAG